MSYYFGKRSKRNLVTCHSDLIEVFENAIKRIDFTVIDGHRNKDRQNEYFLRGVTKVKFPNSEHNGFPSLAADCIPCPFRSDYWTSNEGKKKFEEMAVIIMGEAYKLGIKLLWGYAAWGWDLPHFQLVSRNGVKYEKKTMDFEGS